MLAPDRKVDQEVPRIISVARETHLVYRMTEGNSCYRGGKPGVSNAFCSALWAADYLLKLASFGCAGVNLHGGGAGVIRSPSADICRESSFPLTLPPSRPKAASTRPLPAAGKRDSAPGRSSTA